MQTLIDSGAEVTLMSERAFQRLGRPFRSKRSNDKLPTLVGVTGKGLHVVGKALLPVLIGTFRVNHTFQIVRDLRKDVILGSDFLRLQGATLDFENRSMRVGGQTILLSSKHTEAGEVSLVKAKSTIIISPRSEVVVPAHCARTLTGPILVSPLDNSLLFQDQPGLMMTPQLVSTDRMMVTIQNQTGKTFKLKKGQVFAHAETAKKVESVSLADLDRPEGPQTLREEVAKDFKLGHIPPGQRYQLLTLLKKNDHMFAATNLELGRTNIVKVKLDTGDAPPSRLPPYRLPINHRTMVEEEVQAMLEAGVISPSDSPWSSPIVIVPKPDGTKRFCVDYRKVNALLKNNSAYPLPHIQDTVSSLGGAKYFTILDLKSSYWQVGMADEESRQRTAFTCFLGLYQFNVLPFGIALAPSVFQACMNKVLAGILHKYALSYIDDIVVYSTSFDEHLKHLADVLARLEAAGLKLKASKCEFLKPQVKYLGHLISADGIAPDTEKVSAIAKMEPPKNVKGVRSFLGMLSFYRQYLPDLAQIAKPLTELARKNARFTMEPRSV